MNRLLALSLFLPCALCAAESAPNPAPLDEPEESAWSFDAGGDLRVRQEFMDNVPGLPGGGLMSRAVRGGYRNHMRFRPRVWGELAADAGTAGKWRLHTRLTDEFRWYVDPDSGPYDWPDEAIVDNLFVEGTGLADGLFDVSVGRQDILRLYGLDHVFTDGTPGDGLRTIYADMVRLCWHATSKSSLDLFGIYNEDDNRLRVGSSDSDHRSCTGIAAGAEPEMDDWGFGAVWRSEIDESLPYTLFLLQKSTRVWRDAAGTRHPWTRRNAFGVKVEPRIDEAWSLRFEGMGQLGRNGAGDTLSGWSTFAGVNWKSAEKRAIRPFGSLGWHFMSGDGDAASEDGGHSAWDPLWARDAIESEMFVYGTHYGNAWWSNMHYVKLAAGFGFAKGHEITGSTGPILAANQDGLGGGDGLFKGLLSRAKYSFPLWPAGDGGQGRLQLRGHLIGEFFNPGDYYETSRPAWFARWQIELIF